jgi:small subunit ribosomal protein S1
MSSTPSDTDEAQAPTANTVIRRRRSQPATPSDGVAEASAVAEVAPADAPEPDSKDPQVAAEPAEQAAEVQGRQVSSSGAASDELSMLLAADSGLSSSQSHKGDALSEADVALAMKEPAAPVEEQDFATLLAAYGGLSKLKPGERVKGTILSISDSTAFVDVGGKAEATIERRELLDDSGELRHKVGDELEASVVKNSDGVVQLSLGALQAQLLSEMLSTAVETGLPVEGRVTGFNEGGLEVRVGGRRAFCPRSQIDTYGAGSLQDYVGRDLSFLVTKYEESGRNLVLSRRQLMERQSKEMAEQTRGTLEVGSIIDGVVRKVMPFGAFVDLGGLDGLVHVSEISWRRVEDPSEVVSAGQQVKVKVLKIDTSKDRISLSLRQASDNPWDGVKNRYEVGQSYPGKVSRLTDFGAFIDLEDGVEGLVHVSEIDWTKRINHPSEALEVGQEITVSVKEVDAKRNRLSLSMKRVGPDPWAEIAGGLKVGTEIEVTVEKVADFGIFCTIAAGVTGLLPTSQAIVSRSGNIRREFQPGKSIKVGVLALDRRARKVTLSQRALEESGGVADYKAYRKQVEKDQKDQPSALALAFAAAKKDKDGN